VTDHFFFILWGGTKSLGSAATSGLLYKPQLIDESDCGTIGGMKIDRGNRSTRRKPAPAPIWPPQIPHDQTTDHLAGLPMFDYLRCYTVTEVIVVTGHLAGLPTFDYLRCYTVTTVIVVTGHLAGLPVFDYLRCHTVTAVIVVTGHWLYSKF
jgi:hypothetical protein